MFLSPSLVSNVGAICSVIHPLEKLERKLAGMVATIEILQSSTRQFAVILIITYSSIYVVVNSFRNIETVIPILSFINYQARQTPSDRPEMNVYFKERKRKNWGPIPPVIEIYI